MIQQESDPPADETLVDYSRSGDTHAFGLLVGRHQNIVCGVAYAICGDFGVSEDIAQEAFIVAWKRIRSIKEHDRFLPWVSSIARNLAKSYVRKSARRRNLDDKSIALDDTNAPVTPEENAVTSEESRLVWEGIATLADNYREPLILYYREQKSISSVAEALGLSHEVIRKRLSRGRALLRDTLLEKVERTLATTGPKSSFAAQVIAALPPIAVVAAASVPSTAEAATTAKIISAANTPSVFGSMFASSLLGVTSLRLFVKYLRSDQVSGNLKRAVLRTSLLAFVVSAVFSGYLGWLAWDLGATLEKMSVSPVVASAVALALFLGTLAILARRLHKTIAAEPKLAASMPAACYRFESKLHMAGLPLVSIAVGSDRDTSESHGIARAWIAIGDIAIGVIAIGIHSVGVVSIGATSLGVIGLGGTAVGVLSGGCIAIGGAAVGCIAYGWNLAVANIAVSYEMAIGVLAVSSDRGLGQIAVVPEKVVSSVVASEWAASLLELVPYAGWLALLCLPALFIAGRRFEK